MKKAAIDIGTNSTRLFIAEVKHKRITNSILRAAKITRLGEKVDATKKLSPTAIGRTVKVLKDYRSIIESEKVDKVKAVATSAVREAKNAAVFLDKVADECGFAVDVLDGGREAELSYIGATTDAKLRKQGHYYFVIDIGGGSTELIFGDSKKITSICSLNAGCVRLMEMFFVSDPPTADNIKGLRNHLRAKLKSCFPEGLPPDIKIKKLVPIAVAGTSTSLVAVDREMEPYDPNIVHGSLFSRERTEYMLLKLSKMPLDKIKRLKGLDPQRADVIVAGAAIQAEIMDYFDLDKVRVSEKDILDGIVLKE